MKTFFLKHKTKFVMLFSGILTSVPLVFTSLGALQWFSVIPVAIFLIRMANDKDVPLKRIYGSGVLFFFGYYAVVFHWFFYMYPLDFTGLSNMASLAVVCLACFGIALFQAVQSALAFLIFGFAVRALRIRMLAPVLISSLWAVLEWWQTVGWWGVPWGRLSLGQIDATVFVRSSSLFGSYFVTFIIICVNFYIAMAIVSSDARRIAAIVAIGAFSLNLAIGSAVTLLYDSDGESVTVAAIQGNVPSSEKWDDGKRGQTVEIYRELTNQAAAEGAQLVVWPETALPYNLFADSELKRFVSELAEDNGITIIVSAFTRDEKTGNRQNSMIEVRPDGTFGENVYSKQRLVPFGEFVPMRSIVTALFPPLADIGMLEDDLTAGNESMVFDTEHGAVGCGVCFDSIYESVIYDSVRNGAQIIAISTNDSWFKDSAALNMHNSQSRLRAIENGRFVVRSANTGISSVIDPLGNVCEYLGPLERGYVIADVTLNDEVTLYSVIGNTFIYVCAVFVAGIAVSAFFDVFVNVKFVKKH